MAHARIVIDRVYALIADKIEAGLPAPSNGEIGEHVRVYDADSVRSILATLADAGRISIDWKARPRAIMLGRKASVFTPAPRPIRSVARPRRSRTLTLDETADRIKAILARGKAAVAPVENEYPRGVSGTSRKDPSGTVSAVPSRALGSTPPQQPLADRHEDRAPVQSATISPARRMKPGQDGCGEGARSSGDPDRSDAAPHTPILTPARKPSIRAPIVAAAMRDDIPLADFVEMLIARGFASYEADAALERAA